MKKVQIIISYNVILAFCGLGLMFWLLTNILNGNRLIPEKLSKTQIETVILESNLLDSIKKSKTIISDLHMLYQVTPFGIKKEAFIDKINDSKAMKPYLIIDELYEQLFTIKNELDKTQMQIMIKNTNESKRINLLDVLLAMCISGLLGGVLANLRGVFEFYREINKFPDKLFIPYLIRPLTAILSGLFVFFLANTIVSSTSVSNSSHYIPYKGLITFMGMAILAGFASQEFTERLKSAASTLFGVVLKDNKQKDGEQQQPQEIADTSYPPNPSEPSFSINPMNRD